MLFFATVLSCHAVTFRIVPFGSSGATSSAYTYVVIQLKLKSLTRLMTCFPPVGRIASTIIALPRRCMCGWKLSMRAASRSTVKPSASDTVFGRMSIVPSAAGTSDSDVRNFGSCPFG